MQKVLVIEDNKDNLRLITYALERHGFEVIAADTGMKGVELAVSTHPYFIIMDINLPDIDGYEATRRIRGSKANGDIPIIAITSYAMSGDSDRIIAAGCNGYFEKPIDPLTITDKILELLDQIKGYPGTKKEQP
ncbi:polar-differentiation response regulator DivK [Geobacter sp. OR-1]|uniref:response regulator n=1 Tax=Geobacter sp. OR-1 TaxID=1266765 RepID=UPI000544162C|nr:response regulator [Geobacter sp. OR-1]GAM10800.1 polar-differentiation response regulator DivK [Geobacter sp. OR-1]